LENEEDMRLSSEQIGVAIVGCGYWGVNYVRIMSELPNARVVAVCDQRTERLREVGRNYPEIELTRELDQVLAHEDVDTVIICTTAATHFNIASQCLAAGKHVLVEKPLTTIAGDADALIKMAEARHLTLMVGHTFMYNAAVQTMKRYLQQKDFGKLYYLYARRTNLGPIRTDVNAIWDLAPHDISIFNYLLDDKPGWVSAVGARVLGSTQEDVGFITLGYPNEVVGNIHVSWADPNKVRELALVGSNKRIVFDDLNAMERVKVFEKGVEPAQARSTNYGEFQFQIRNGDIVSPYIEASEPLKNQCSHFLECVQYGRDPLTDGQAGLDVVQVLAAIDESIAQNGVPINVETGRICELSPSAIAHMMPSLEAR
jgi:predicted dehydrogenase